MNDNIVAWGSKKIKTIVDSSTEAEYIGMFEGMKEGLFIRNLLKELGFKIGYINLCGDNMSSLTLSSHSTLHQRTKHIDIKYHRLRQLIESKKVKPNYINTRENIADILTKALDSTSYQNLFKLIKEEQS